MAFIFLFFLNQAFERYSFSPVAQGVSFACVANISGADAIRVNPAALTLLNKNSLSAGYEYTFSGIDGLRNISLGFARPLPYGSMGIAISEFGFTEEKEQALTGAYSFGLSKDFFLGLGFDLYIINNRRMGNGYSYGVNLGLKGRLAKKWALGVYGHNLNQAGFGDTDIGKLPPLLQVGLGYRPFDDISSEIDFSTTEGITRIHIGGEYKIFDFFVLRSGLITYPQSVSFGSGIFYKFIKIDYAVEYLPDLPLSHSLSINFEF